MRVLLFSILIFATAMPCMAYDKADLEVDIKVCGAAVHEDTLKALIKVESNFKPLAIADGGPVNLPWRMRKSMVRSFYPKSKEEAVRKAAELIEQGHTVSLGLTMINDRNLRWMGLSLADAFDPCLNMRYGSKLLLKYYLEASRVYPEKGKALQAALSKYNSGDFKRGLNEGYVDLVFGDTRYKNELRNASIKNDYNYYKQQVREFSMNGFKYE